MRYTFKLLFSKSFETLSFIIDTITACQQLLHSVFPSFYSDIIVWENGVAFKERKEKKAK